MFGIYLWDLDRNLNIIDSSPPCISETTSARKFFGFPLRFRWQGSPFSDSPNLEVFLAVPTVNSCMGLYGNTLRSSGDSIIFVQQF